MKKIRIAVLGLGAALLGALSAITSLSVAADELCIAMNVGYGVEVAQFEMQLQHQANLPAEVSVGAIAGLVPASHGYMQIAADVERAKAKTAHTS